ncbi:signal-transducing adaptor protein 2-like [Parambassis ranga]|uniref:Signal-transducing adaptor protein 2-like n=1 Tax=Parambassis ranga TaxID=210632 RepID=A0A6P7HSK5_9TELE|nr:signal-transducing adaptor protein 2-like [Parambassis ranga]XP_028260270.1 signal-transducing adaptor protein 2-like [Parambassis ranga]
MAKRAGRQRNQLPNCYYEGYLEKRSFKDKTSRKLWACLCGNTLFFFNDKRDTDYIEKLDLSGLISITDDGTQDRKLDAARLNLQMKDGNIKFTAPTAEARELWKGFIHSVAELCVPSSINLLPGQIHMLKEAVEKEKERIKNVSPPAAPSYSPYISLQADMPACYYSVSRLEAELLLEREAKRGNLLLRPGSAGNSFAVTTRQDLDGAIFRHYRVTRKHEGGFIIDVNIPVPCATLHDVIDYLVKETDGVLIPLIFEEPYEKNISFIRSDNENGEMSVQQALSNPPPSIPPKPVAPKVAAPESEPAPMVEENLYLNDTLEETETETEESSPSLSEKRVPKKPMMPPTAAPRKSTSNTPASSCTNRNYRTRANTDSQRQIPLAAITELKLKLEQKAKSVE